jgi:nucleotide-binding universal stress UspA family protein
VVVCLDGNVGAGESLRFAFEEADRSDRTLVVFHAVGPHADPDEMATERRDIAEITAGWQEQFPSVLVLHETAADARSDAIIAASDGAAMVIVGSPHRPSWSWLYSLARTVMNRVGCPLVVVPQGAPSPPRETSQTNSIAPVPTY